MKNEDPTEPQITFVHLSDCHVVAEAEAMVYGVDTAKTLEAVIQRVNALRPRPHFAIFGGDLVSPDLGPKPFQFSPDAGDRQYEQAYLRFRAIVDQLQMPKYYVVGNHDRRELLRKVLLDQQSDSSPHDFHFSVDGYFFVVLDTQDPGKVPGKLTDAQLTWLRGVLESEASGVPVMIVTHHPPIPIGIDYLDKLGLKNAQALFAVLRDFPNVRWMLSGHVHNEAATGNPLEIFTTPSTCFQFTEENGKVGVKHGAPAFRLGSLRDGQLTTRVITVEA